MITHIEVDGFKSLSNFAITLNKGLNVLIGPNGAGKSNICQALGIIAAAAEGNISDYLLSLGGVGSTFTIPRLKESLSARERKMSVSCKGETQIESRPDEIVKLKYAYHLSLTFRQHLRIYNESIKIYRLSPKGRFRLILSGQLGKDKKIIITIPDRNFAGPLSRIGKVSKKFDYEMPEIGLKNMLPFLPAIAFYAHVVNRDMSFSRAWNIDPHIAKKSSDVLDPTIILPDGRHLSNAILSMHESQSTDLAELNTFMKHILPRFESLNPEISEDKIRRSFSVTDANGIKCPANSLSDGTIKAIALLVGVFGQKNNTAIIEEPENYLHPWAAESLVDFFRDQFTESVCVLTTHSETVLNSVKANEIIVVENIAGHTSQNRLSSRNKLASTIRRSGFGAGYHYVAGSLGGIPL